VSSGVCAGRQGCRHEVICLNSSDPAQLECVALMLFGQLPARRRDDRAGRSGPPGRRRCVYGCELRRECGRRQRVEARVRAHLVMVPALGVWAHGSNSGASSSARRPARADATIRSRNSGGPGRPALGLATLSPLAGDRVRDTGETPDIRWATPGATRIRQRRERQNEKVM